MPAGNLVQPSHHARRGVHLQESEAGGLHVGRNSDHASVAREQLREGRKSAGVSAVYPTGPTAPILKVNVTASSGILPFINDVRRRLRTKCAPRLIRRSMACDLLLCRFPRPTPSR